MEEKKDKTYNIKIPVYISEKSEEKAGIFEPLSFDEMIKLLADKIDSYNQNPVNVTNDKRNKTVIKEIEKVDYSIVPLGSEKGILLKITASNTNFFDGYYKSEKDEDEKINLQKSDKLGSDNNFILLYPKITGYQTSNFKYEWIILVYEDPNKEASEIISIAKIVLKKILNISIANVKLPDLVEKLNQISIIPELQLKLSSIEYEDSDVDNDLVEYLLQSKVIKQKENVFLNVPFQKVKELINSLRFVEKYRKKRIKIINGKNEITILQEHINEAEDKLKTTIEEIFNQSSIIHQNDIDNDLIYKEDFIVEKLKPVLDNYLVSYA